MSRNIRIHGPDEESPDFSIDIGRHKNRSQDESCRQRNKPAASLFLREMTRLIGRITGHHSGRHLFVRNTRTASQRVIVKSRFVRHVTPEKGFRSLKDHCGYITRRGVEAPDEKSPAMYRGSGALDGPALDDWLTRCSHDRHHFRFIISPENSGNLDLTAYTRELVSQMESDLGTRLDYLAVNHFNTDTPHSHLVIRGVTDSGKDLVISRDYISNGVRNRAREIANEHLGLRTELEIRNGMTREVERQGFTQIDRELKSISKKNPDRLVDLRTTVGWRNSFGEFRQKTLLQRVKFLEAMGLARQARAGVWRLERDFEHTLRDLGMRDDIIKTMHRSLCSGNQEKRIFDPNGGTQKITGQVVDGGIADELNDRQYLIVSATDNRLYYVPLPNESGQPGREAMPGAIVTVSAAGADHHFRVADKSIITLAAANGGIYDVEKHRRQVNRHRLPEGVTVDVYLENFLKRMKALERRNLVERAGEGTWKIPPDLKERLLDHGVKKARVRLESAAGLEQQIGSRSPTWLDRELAAGRLPGDGEQGSEFTRELDRAKQKRIETLLRMGVACRVTGGITLRREFLEAMREQRLGKSREKVRKGRDREH